MTGLVPTAGISGTAARTGGNEIGEGREFKGERVGLKVETDNGEVTWTWTVKRMEDGSLYKGRTLRDARLVAFSNFAVTSSLLDVRGTWAYPKDAGGTVTLQARVGQTLGYDAAVQKGCLKPFELRTYLNKPGESPLEDVMIPLEIPI